MSELSLPAAPLRIRSIRAHGPLLITLAWKNVRLRYKSSFLGFFWSLLNPLLFLVIFWFIFSHAFPAVRNYPVFALSGLICWSFFSTSSSHILTSLVDNAQVLKSLAVPPLVFPLSQLLAGSVNLVLSLVPFGIILVLLGWHPHPVHVLAIPALLLFAAFLFGVSLALCAFHVYFRDIGLLWSALLPAFFYLTPIAYPPELIPLDLRWVMELNPLYHFIDQVRGILYRDAAPDLASWVTTFLLATAAMILGAIIFRSLRRGFIANY